MPARQLLTEAGEIGALVNVIENPDRRSGVEYPAAAWLAQKLRRPIDGDLTNTHQVDHLPDQIVAHRSKR